MLRKLRKQKLTIVVTAVLSLWLAVLPSVSGFMDTNSIQSKVNSAAVTTTCQQARVGQMQITQNCQQTNSYQTLNEITVFDTKLQNLLGLLSFLFVMALISMGPISRLFKPPKNQVAY